jgi:hypothetical protein
VQEVNYSDQPNFVLPAGTSVYEYFTGFPADLFDLDNANVLFTPQADGSYLVRTVLPPAPTETLTITGGPEAAGNELQSIAAQASTPQANGAFGKAEVEVLSSGDVGYRGQTNTNELGRFSLSGVPPGAIVITVRKKDKVIAQGSLIARGNSDQKHVSIKHPEKKKKSTP